MEALTYDVSVDGKSARIEVRDSTFVFRSGDGAPLEREFTLVPGAPGVASILIAGRSYQVIDLGGGEISVNGRIFRAEAFDPRSLRGKRGTAQPEGKQSLASPMPGRVVRVLVEPGQEVEPGQGVVVVEAMKMQNELKASQRGRVTGLHASPGAAVAAGEVLVVIES